MQLEIRNSGKLFVRGMLPLKPKVLATIGRSANRRSGAAAKQQQRLPLGIVADSVKAIERAEMLASLIAQQVNLREFRWQDWQKTVRKPRGSSLRLVGDAWAVLEAQFWGDDNSKSNPKKAETWRVAYFTVGKTLPPNMQVTGDNLRDWILERSPATRRREHFVTVANRLCKISGVQADFSDLMTGISDLAINPRNLPTDEYLRQIYEEAPEPYKRPIGLMIAYGLRNHEVFGVQLDTYPEIEVAPWTKEGMRYVLPLWLKDDRGEDIVWDLQNGPWPEQWPPHWTEQPVISNSKLGSFVSRYFRHYTEIAAYDVRHCFARHCRDRGLDAYTSAALMGHSERTHRRKYQAWFGKRYHLDEVRRKTGIG